MSAFPCPTAIDCECPDFPFSNFSSEDPDPFLYVAFGYGNLGNSDPPGFPPRNGKPDSPKIGTTWTALGCVSLCTSAISQEDANLCAARQQVECNTGTWDPHRKLYLSAQQTVVVHCADGMPFSFTLGAGAFVALSQTLANSEALSYARRQAQIRKVCISALSRTEACVGSAFTASLSATGPFIFAAGWDIVGGELPPGLAMVGLGGSATISGTPDTGGSYTFTIQVTELNGDFMTKTFTICAIDISPATLPDAINGTAYLQTLTASTCAPLPLSWQVTSGSLPPGLFLNETTGVISGTPTTVGVYSFTVSLQTSAT